MLRVLFLFFLLIVSPVQGAESPVSDPGFEKRLVSMSIYTTKKGDTLQSIAHFLYGHDSWWIKIQKDNPRLQTFSFLQTLPESIQIRYRTPEVGETYTVQPNDWLLRIVQWKYGATEQWKEIYQKNAQKISNPNLIHPGDVLILSLDGTVRQNATRQVLVEGVETAENRADSQSGEPPASPVQLSHSTQQTDSDIQTHSSNIQTNSAIQTGTGQTRSSRELASSNAAHTEGGEVKFGVELGSLEAWLFSIFLLTCACLYWQKPRFAFISSDIFSIFKIKKMNRRPSQGVSHQKHGPQMEELQIRRDLIHRDVGDLEAAPGYERILPSSRKKSRE